MTDQPTDSPEPGRPDVARLLGSTLPPVDMRNRFDPDYEGCATCEIVWRIAAGSRCPKCGELAALPWPPTRGALGRRVLIALNESGLLADDADEVRWAVVQIIVNALADTARKNRATATMNGMEIIYAERARHDTIGYTPEHDLNHADGALADAASCYASSRTDESTGIVDETVPAAWPWDAEDWHPSPDDRVRELAIAGSLIAAEIDRLLWMQRRAAEMIKLATKNWLKTD